MAQSGSLRETHPNLYRTYLVYAAASIALGLNFILLTPTFMPLDMPKWPVGLLFFGCGVSKLALLLTNSHNSWMRASMALSVFIYFFWGGILTFEFFRLSQTSLQLPLTYIALAALGILLLTEPFSNPATSTETNGQ